MKRNSMSCVLYYIKSTSPFFPFVLPQNNIQIVAANAIAHGIWYLIDLDHKKVSSLISLVIKTD